MRIKVISDLHLEFYNNLSKASIDQITIDADVLILAGDIGYPGSSLYRDFIDRMASSFKYVILITGNHEYYITSARKWSVSEVDKYLEKLVENWTNVYYLHNTSIFLDGYRFLGTTLWTQISDEEYVDIAFRMNDYKKIYFNSRQTISPHHTVKWHREAVEWLESELKEEIPTIVITHHAPSKRKEVLNRDSSGMSSAYVNDLESMIPKHVLLWVYGHTHHPADFIANNGVTRIVNNPFGYKREFDREFHRRAGSKVITIPDIEAGEKLKIKEE